MDDRVQGEAVLGWQVRATRGLGLLLIGAAWLLGGCHEAADHASHPAISATTRVILSGTRIHVALASSISSETARVGDAWHGTVTENVMGQNENLIPPGSEVDGVIADVASATGGSPARLELSIEGIRINGRRESITANAAAVVSGSDRERLLGDAVGVAQFRDHQVVLTDETVMSFVVLRTVRVR